MNESRILTTAIHLLARQLADLPIAIVRAQRDADRIDRATNPPGRDTGKQPSGPVDIRGLDTEAANQAHRVTAAVLPRVDQLIQLLTSKLVAGVTGVGNLHHSRRNRRGRIGGVSGLDRLNRRQRRALPKNPYAKRLSKGMSSTGTDAGKQVAALLKSPMIALGAALTPLAMAATVINSTLSGFQLVTASIKVFAATVAPVLMPFFFLLAAGLTYLSDKIWQDIAPALQSWYQTIITHLAPAVATIIDAFTAAARAINALFGSSPHKIEKQAADLEEMMTRGLQPLLTGAGNFTGSKGAGGSFDGPPPSSIELIAGGVAKAVFGGGGGGGNNPLSGFGAAMKDVLKEFQSQMGPRASFSGLAQASRNAQLAALNSSPFEVKVLERMQHVINSLSKVIDNTAQPTSSVGR